MLMENMCWNLFLSIVHILATFFLLSSECRLLSMSSLIRLTLFDKAIRKSFFFSLRANTSMNGQRFSTAKLSLMSVILTNSRLGCGFPTIVQWQFCYWSLLMVQIFQMAQSSALRKMIRGFFVCLVGLTLWRFTLEVLKE